ncbi:MAG TPA: glycosyltransferase family 4 protein [Solimonas sp.]
MTAPSTVPAGARLLVIVNNFPPDRGGGAAVFGDLCYGLAAQGYDVTVRCAYPYYPEWRDKSGRNGWHIWRYDEHGVHVERYGLYIPKQAGSILPRLLHEASFLLSLLRSVPRSRGFDAVMVICPALSSVVVAVLIRLLFRKPLWLNVQDLAVEAAAGSGLLKAGLLARTARGLQRWLFNRADLWSSISPVMCDALAAQRRRAQPLLLIPNWMDEDLGREIRRLHQERPRSGPRTPVRLLYGGNIGMKQNLLALLQHLQRSDADFQFTIHGDGAQAGAVRDWIASTADPRFRFGPLLDARGFAEALFDADYFVITESPNAGASFMPSKLVGGIAAGLPILTVSDANSPLGSEVRGHNLGPWFGWDHLHKLTEFVTNLANDPEYHRQAVARSGCRAGDFERNRLVAHMGAVFADLIAKRAPEGSDRR